VGERCFELVVGRDRERGGRGVGGSGVGVPGARDGVAELAAPAHLVELALAGQARLEKLPGLLGLHVLPLPIGDAAGVRARPAGHADDDLTRSPRRRVWPPQPGVGTGRGGGSVARIGSGGRTTAASAARGLAWRRAIDEE
jgi:hypothetical protein